MRTGQLAFRLGREVRSWRATDFSSAMVREAEWRSTLSNTSFEVKKMQLIMSYEDRRFDVVLIANALDIIPEPGRALAEIRRVLKPEGLLTAPAFVHESGTNYRLFKLFKLFSLKPFYKCTMGAVVCLRCRAFATLDAFNLLYFGAFFAVRLWQCPKLPSTKVVSCYFSVAMIGQNGILNL